MWTENSGSGVPLSGFTVRLPARRFRALLGKMAEVALGRGALGTRHPVGVRRRRFLGLGQRPFELLQGEPELVGMKLLGLLPEHRPAQLAKQVFETAVLLFQMAVETFEAAVALGERRDLGVKGLERGPVGGLEGRRIEPGNSRVHDRNTITESKC